MKVLDMNAVIRDTEPMLRETLNGDIQMTACFAPNKMAVRADAKLMQQVILALAARARQAISAMGCFTIETKHIRLDSGAIPDLAPGPYVLLTLADSGVGMNDAALDRVFDPLQQDIMDSETGMLNLSRIPGILRRFGGHIQAECQADQGATFKIFLPRCDDAGTTVKGGETILLVDDEDSIRALIRVLLQSQGYQVLEAVSGDAAIRFAETWPTPIDLLITDVTLPGINGPRLMERVLGIQPAIKVLLISGYAEDQLALSDVPLADFAFLQKPFRCDVLQKLVRRMLDANGDEGA